MIRDPFYRDIIARLNERLDPELFEQCAADLLREIYPGLVPIRGGADSGMDGAIADGEDEPFPLVTTTGKNVIGNLTRNLNSYLGDGGQRRRVALATSQSLTPTRIRNLYKRARKLGFGLVNVHEQASMADLLYHRPKWCLELLNLTGTPPALSIIPKTQRPRLTQTIVGREEGLLWLSQTTGDRLLVGQPGSGKTFLLSKFAREKGGLFVVSEDRTEIASNIRAEQPAVLILDDVQLHPEFVAELKQIREVIGADFSIIATCWPSEKGKIQQRLAVPKSQVHELGLLTRNQIVEIIHEAGISRPNWLIDELVNQSGNRPGLAVTLSHLYLLGGAEEVLLGEALSREIVETYRPLAGSSVREVLAAFSVGGNAGMSKEAVAEELELRMVDVTRALVTLGAGGVVLEVDDRHLSVYPSALRHALVRDVFFCGALSLEIEGLIDQAPYLPDVISTLIGAKSRGGDVPAQLLTQKLEENPHLSDVWTEYAWLGADQVHWILQNYPEKLNATTRPVLHHAPGVVLPLLLEKVIQDQRPLNTAPDHPLRVIEDWTQEVYLAEEALARRQTLCKVLTKWFSNDKDVETGLRALKSVFSWRIVRRETDPGKGDIMHLRSGSLLADQILALQDLWPEAVGMIKGVRIQNWIPLQDIVRHWAYPISMYGYRLPEERYNMIRSFGGKMLSDLLSLAENRPGILHWINEEANNLDLDLNVPLDEAFEILYPVEDLEDWQESQQLQVESVRQLAAEWSEHNPSQVAERIVSIEREAEVAGVSYPRWISGLCSFIAENVSSPAEWGRALLNADAPSDCIAPFLYQAGVREEPGWESLALACLDLEAKEPILSVLLRLPNCSEELQNKTLGSLSGYDSVVSTLCIRQRLSETVIERLLRHSDSDIAVAAARGIWAADPEGSVPESLYDNWRGAALLTADAHWLSKALTSDAKLAYDWLQVQARLGEDRFLSPGYEKALRAAISVLDKSRRREILSRIAEEKYQPKLVLGLIEDDLELYSDVLDDEGLEQYHLVPLAGIPNDVWIEKAKLAIGKGYSPREVAYAAYGYPLSIVWTTPDERIEELTDYTNRFEHLLSHKGEDIRKIGEHGKAIAEKRLERILQEQRMEDLHGIDWRETLGRRLV